MSITSDIAEAEAAQSIELPPIKELCDDLAKVVDLVEDSFDLVHLAIAKDHVKNIMTQLDTVAEAGDLLLPKDIHNIMVFIRESKRLMAENVIVKKAKSEGRKAKAKTKIAMTQTQGQKDLLAAFMNKGKPVVEHEATSLKKAVERSESKTETAPETPKKKLSISERMALKTKSGIAPQVATPKPVSTGLSALKRRPKLGS